MTGEFNLKAKVISASESSAAGTEKVVTVAAVAGKHWVLRRLTVSFAGPVDTIETLSVTFGAAIKFLVLLPVTTVDGSIYQFPFEEGLYAGIPNQDMIITVTGTRGAEIAVINYSYQ